MTTYKIINLVREDFNKAIVFYDTSSEKVAGIFRKLHSWLKDNKESDLYANIIKNNSDNLIMQQNMACIDLLVDDSWWTDSDLEKVLNEIC